MAAPPDPDYYETLGLTLEATKPEIGKAYRKLALKYHPDRNPDPTAADMFRVIFRAYEVLNAEETRAAYDKIARARIMKKQQFAQMDEKMRKMREDLERKEQAAFNVRRDVAGERARMQKEIERLRREGLAMQQDMAQSKPSNSTTTPVFDRAASDIREMAKNTASVTPPPPPPKPSTSSYEPTSATTAPKAFQRTDTLPTTPLFASGSAASFTPLFASGSNASFPSFPGATSFPSFAATSFPAVSSFPSDTSSFPGGPSATSDRVSSTVSSVRQSEERKRLIRQLEEEEARESGKVAKTDK